MQNKTFLIVIVISVLLASSALGEHFIGTVLANPLPGPNLNVTSPQDNKIYSSNNIQLDFTVLPNIDEKYTSFSYILDGQQPQETDGSTILTGLSEGSHTLQIHGNTTYMDGDSVVEYSPVLAIIHFSIAYSTSWIVLTIVTVAAFSMILLVFVIKRRQLLRAGKGKKTSLLCS